MEAESVVASEEAMGQFKKMRKEAEEIVSKVGSFQELAAKFLDGAAETMNLSISKSEEYLAGVQKLVEAQEAHSNPLFHTLIQLMEEDLVWFKKEGTRLAKIREHFAEMSRV